MTHSIYRVVDFEIIAPYTLKIDFDDGESQTINFSPVLFGELYGPLQDIKLFESVEIDYEVHTLVWANGADFDPATLHDWDIHASEMQKMAQKWDMAKAGVAV